MNKKKYFILLFLIFVIAILKITIAGKQNELDQWIGLYNYGEDSEFINEHYKIIIWEQNKVFLH